MLARCPATDLHNQTCTASAFEARQAEKLTKPSFLSSEAPCVEYAFQSSPRTLHVTAYPLCPSCGQTEAHSRSGQTKAPLVPISARLCAFWRHSQLFPLHHRCPHSVSCPQVCLRVTAAALASHASHPKTYSCLMLLRGVNCLFYSKVIIEQTGQWTLTA